MFSSLLRCTHADAAKLMIETMYSDEGQMEYAKVFVILSVKSNFLQN
jgi:hypothetical protein